MNTGDLLIFLALPESASVDRRIPKKQLLEIVTATSIEKRLVQASLERLQWVATLKPTTIAVPEYQDANRTYLELAVLSLTLNSAAKWTPLLKLIHRAIPYPLLLLTEGEGQVGLSMVHKRPSLNNPEKTVLDDDITDVRWEKKREESYLAAFGEALALDQQPHTDLFALYQGWMNTLTALQAAQLTGTFRVTHDPEQTTLRRQALRDCARYQTEMTSLRAAAGKEKQMARKVDLNMDLKRIEAAHASAKKRL